MLQPTQVLNQECKGFFYDLKARNPTNISRISCVLLLSMSRIPLEGLVALKPPQTPSAGKQASSGSLLKAHTHVRLSPDQVASLFGL